MKKLFLAVVVVSLNFVSCSSDDLETTNEVSNVNSSDVVTIIENEPIKDKTRD